MRFLKKIIGHKKILRKNIKIKSYMKKVNDDADAIIIAFRNGEDNSVLMSQDEYDNLIENAYVRSSKANVDHIMKSWTELKNGNGKEHNWQ